VLALLGAQPLIIYQHMVLLLFMKVLNLKLEGAHSEA
jgi:hypothetical protein